MQIELKLRYIQGWTDELGRKSRLQQGAVLFECMPAAIGPLGLIADGMGQSGLGHFARSRRLVAGPIAETRTEAVGRAGHLQPQEQPAEAFVAERLQPVAGEYPLP
jgi:hypothetical protein